MTEELTRQSLRGHGMMPFGRMSVSL